MKKILIIALTAIVMVVIAAPAQAQNKRAEKKAQQEEVYNKAKTAIETGRFIFLPDRTGKNPTLDNRTTFILIKGDKGAAQFGPPATSSGLRSISNKEIETKPNGDVIFKCTLELHDRTKNLMTITLKNSNNIAYATYGKAIEPAWIGKIIPENEAKYFIYHDLRYNE